MGTTGDPLHDATSTSPAPIPAASLILFRHDEKTQPTFLLGRRHRNHVFLPGKFVFPGGRSEPEDQRMTATGTLPPDIIERLRDSKTAAPIDAPNALALTAIREMFEETGLLVGDCTEHPVAAPPSESWTQFAEANVIPNLGQLHYVARALTPPGLPRRFDTHFFAADAACIAKTLADHIHDESELVELRWVTLAELVSLDILPVTQFIAQELAQRLLAGLGHELPFPYFHVQDDRWIRTEF